MKKKITRRKTNSLKNSDKDVLAVKDSINVITGKWKIHIIASLLFGGRRYSEIEDSIPNITPRMLSKELRDLEANGIVKRKVYDNLSVTFDYELTKSGESFRNVLQAMLDWGLQHRKNVISNDF